MDVDRAMDLYKVYNQVRSDAPTDDTASASTDTESRLPNVYWYTQNRAAQQQDDIHTFFQNFFKANGKFWFQMCHVIKWLVKSFVESLLSWLRSVEAFDSGGWFPIERFIRSSRSQKTICRTLQGLSIHVPHICTNLWDLMIFNLNHFNRIWRWSPQFSWIYGRGSYPIELHSKQKL